LRSDGSGLDANRRRRVFPGHLVRQQLLQGPVDPTWAQWITWDEALKQRNGVAPWRDVVSRRIALDVATSARVRC